MAASNFHRHLTFKRMYSDDSGMPEWPPGSTRAMCYRFDNRASMIELVNRMLHNPGEFKPYFDEATPPLMVRVMPGDPGVLPGNFRDSLQFARMLHPQDPEMADALAVETYRTQPGALTYVPNTPYVNLNLTFAIHHDDARYELAKWIEAQKFNGFLNEQAAVYFTAHALPPGIGVDDDIEVAQAAGYFAEVAEEHGSPQPVVAALPMVRMSPNPFAPGGRVPRPVSPAATEASVASENNDDNRSGSDPSGDEESEVPQPDPDSDDDVVPEADDDSDDDAVPVPPPVRPVDNHAQRALRRISDELFDVRREMPEVVYVRLSNSLKRRIDE